MSALSVDHAECRLRDGARLTRVGSAFLGVAEPTHPAVTGRFGYEADEKPVYQVGENVPVLAREGLEGSGEDLSPGGNDSCRDAAPTARQQKGRLASVVLAGYTSHQIVGDEAVHQAHRCRRRQPEDLAELADRRMIQEAIQRRQRRGG